MNFEVNYHTASGKRVCFRHAVVLAVETNEHIRTTVEAVADGDYYDEHYVSEWCSECASEEAAKRRILDERYRRGELTPPRLSDIPKKESDYEETEKGTRWKHKP